MQVAYRIFVFVVYTDFEQRQTDDGPLILAGVPTSYLAKLISSSWPWLHTYMDDFEIVDVNGLTVMVEIVANNTLEIGKLSVSLFFHRPEGQSHDNVFLDEQAQYEHW